MNQQLAIARSFPVDAPDRENVAVRDLCRLPHEALHRIAKLPPSKRAAALADAIDALQTVRDQEVTLEEELKTLKLYMQIQQIRFGDRLHVGYAVDPVALDARVPHLIFQPLVENAIKYGIADRAAGGHVEVSAQVSDHRLHLAVQDDGPGLCDTHPMDDIGLTNTQERLS